jgi:Na+/H+-dicarboxylate symporter
MIKKIFMKSILSSTIFKLLLAVILGIVLGFLVNESVINAIVFLKYITGQFIFFLVPLIVLGFVAPSIAKLKSDASKLLGLALILAYISTIGAAAVAAVAGYSIIPAITVVAPSEGLKEIPKVLVDLNIPQVMSVMTALVLAIFIGLAATWVKASAFITLLDQFQEMVIAMVNRILIPILPLFVGANFCILSYEGSLTTQLPVFLKVIVIVLVFHFLWLAVLYLVAAFYSRKNPWEVLKHYGPAYLTAIGTMSSAATLGVALKGAKKSKVLNDEIVDFGIPLFANIHLCGSVLTEVFFVLTVSQVLYGTLPAISVIITFILLLGVFAIGAPGVPGGTVVASLGIVVSILGFNEAGTALLIALFALQDSFGTACNITGDGALTLILSEAENRKQLKMQTKQ